ncbi:hypothetical protein TrRE_jg11828, partial [Triparma retinervis]
SPPPGTPTRKIRNSIKLSEKGSVIDIISTEVFEEVKGMPDMVVGGGSHSGGFDRLVINSNSDGRVGGDDVGGGVESSSPSMVANGRNVVVHGGAKGAGLGARFRNVSSPGGGNTLFSNFRGNVATPDRHVNDGYSSSESVSSVGSQDIPLVRKKKREKQHGAVGGLEDVVEETSTAVFSGFNRGVDGVGRRFQAPVNEIATLVEYVYCTSGDLGHNHTLTSTWIPTGLFPQSSTIKFKVPVYLTKLVVECSGVRRMKLIVAGKKEFISPIMPETALVQMNARHQAPGVEILDTPR